MCIRKISSIIPFLLFLSILLSSVTLGQISDAEKLYEQGIYQIEAIGDFEEAIELFNRLVKEYSNNKQITVKALLKLGFCYERLGNQKAEEVYTKIIENYSDQTVQVTKARERLSSLRHQNESKNHTIKLTYGEGYFGSRSLSPDGTKMAGHDLSVGQNIAVYDFITKETTLITRIDWQDSWADYPIWSSDGKELAFIRSGWKKTDPQSLWTTTLDGHSQLIYTSKPGQLIYLYNWLPDKEGIVVILRDSTQNTLGIIPIDKSKFRIIIQSKPGTLHSANISPDGQSVVYSEGPRYSRDIRIINISNKKISTLTDNPADDTSPLWSPDGRHVIFKSKRHGNWALWGLEVKNGLPEKAPFLVMAGADEVKLYNWSHAGLAFNRSIWTNDIYRMPVDPSSGTPISRPEQINYTPTGSNFFPSWSPDGKFFAFISSLPEKQGFYSVIIMARENNTYQEIKIPWKSARGIIRWTPDSKKLGFASIDINKKTKLYRLTLDTEEWQMWPIDVDTWTAIDWDKQNNTYYYAVQGFGSSNRGIIKSVVGINEREFIYRPEKSRGMVFRDLRCSRDYKSLAFQEDQARIVIVETETGKSKTYLSSIPDSSSKKFIKPENFGNPIWSPDGLQLLLTKTITDKNLSFLNKEFYVFNIKENTLNKIDIDITIPKEGMITLDDWSPDGKEVLFNVRSIFREDLLMKKVIPEEQQ